MAFQKINRIDYIECKGCGSILEGDKTQYAMSNWYYYPYCGSNNLKKVFKNEDKEKKTLSDEIMRARVDAKTGEAALVYEELHDRNDTDEPVITVEKAKEKLQEYIQAIKNCPEVNLDNLAKEIFGGRLT